MAARLKRSENSDKSRRQPPVAVLVSRPRLKAGEIMDFSKVRRLRDDCRLAVLGREVPGERVLIFARPKDVRIRPPVGAEACLPGNRVSGFFGVIDIDHRLGFSPLVHQANAAAGAIDQCGFHENSAVISLRDAATGYKRNAVGAACLEDIRDARHIRGGVGRCGRQPAEEAAADCATWGGGRVSRDPLRPIVRNNRFAVRIMVTALPTPPDAGDLEDSRCRAAWRWR